MTEPVHLRVGVFPGAANVPTYHALETGEFVAHGLDVDLIEVRSAKEQLSGWDEGFFDLIVTSPDHLLRERRGVAPRIVRFDGTGEIGVFAWPSSGRRRRWAVDEPGSAFALVLRAVVLDATGEDPVDSFVPVGGTLQRFQALGASGRGVDGAALHPPFDAMVIDLGLERLGGHLDLDPDLVCACTVVRADANQGAAVRYAEAVDAATKDLVALGHDALSTRLEAAGVPRTLAPQVANDLLGPAGFSSGGPPHTAGLEAVVALRRRFDPAFTPAVTPDALLGVTS